MENLPWIGLALEGGWRLEFGSIAIAPCIADVENRGKVSGAYDMQTMSLPGTAHLRPEHHVAVTLKRKFDRHLDQASRAVDVDLKRLVE